MPSWKKVIVSGSDALLNTLTVTNGITGSLQGTASYAINADFLDGRDSSVFATTGSNIFRGNQTVTGSLFTTGSNTLIGVTSLTGSLNISGSETITGYIQFEPVTTNINTAISASYIYVSGSTNDLYFSQNGSGYSNVTRLRWLEGNLYTGLLHGGLITTQSSTVYQISSGSGIIVDLNASLSNDPYPTIQYLNWGNLSASIAPFTASFQQAFVGIDSTNNIYAQGTPFSNGQFSDVINVGNVLFQNQSTINGVKTQPSVAYGFEQQQNTFNRAFGPLKLSGYTLAPSGSSTGSLIVASGTAYAPGSNYTIDPDDPSYTIDPGTNVSKIFRYHQSGSTWVYNTNGGPGFATIDPTKYSNNGVLTNVGGGNWTIQRCFYFPNSVTKAIVVYYGNARYGTEAEARANIDFESFVEAPNTSANAIYLGAIIINGTGVFTSPGDFTIYPGGLFRQVGGSGGGGSIVTQTLAGLSDVNISGPIDGQALVYNYTAAKWENKSSISASITGNAATATSASFATTASYVLNAVSASYATNALSASYAITASHALNANTASYVLNAVTASYALTSSNVQGGEQHYIPLWNTSTSLTSSYLYQNNNTLKTFDFGVNKGLTLSFINDEYFLGNATTSTGSYVGVNANSGITTIKSNNYTIVEDKLGVGMSPTNRGLAVSGSIEVTHGITGSLHGTASWAQNAITSSFVTGSNVFGPFGSNSVISASFAVSASYVIGGADPFPYTGSAQITGSLGVTGSVSATTVQSNVFLSPQIITEQVTVPSGFNGIIIGDPSISGSITISSGSNVTIADFSIPNLQQVTNIGNTTTNSITAANFITTSDRRLKSDIKQIENPFEVLDSIKSYEYVKDGKKDAGFIAQEVQETIPYAVFENEEGMLTMSDRPLLAYLYAAVMELKEENKQLKKELKSIKP